MRGSAGSRVGREWVCFSEYWTYTQGIPDRERRLLRRCLDSASEAAVAVDVGANVGLFTVELAALGFAEVHAFEPSPDTFRRLRANVAVNGLESQVFPNPAAVGDEAGRVILQIEQKSPATNHIADSMHTGGLQVPVVGLDGYLAGRGIRTVHLLKVDVEGWELKVLRGCGEALRRKAVKLVLLEVCPANLSRYGVGPGDLLEEMASAGYALHWLGEDGAPARELSFAEISGIELENVLAVPRVCGARLS